MTATKIYPLFPQTPFTQENEEREQELSNSVSESLTTGARARTRTREEIIEEFSGYYCETFGTLTCPPVAKQRMRICLGSGMDPELIRTAMDEAAMAPRPSWAYANAILMRLLQEECFTLDAYELRQQRWANRKTR